MEFKDNITKIIDEKLYKILLNDLYDKSIKTYLYHFIVVKYKDHNNIYTMKIDNLKDLNKIKDKEILIKYYVEKLHYYNEFSNDLYADGMPCHIYNMGYFLIDGDIELNDKEKLELNELFIKYQNNYSNFKNNDIDFLSLNK